MPSIQSSQLNRDGEQTDNKRLTSLKNQSTTESYLYKTQITATLLLLVSITVVLFIFHLLRIKWIKRRLKQNQILFDMVFDQSYHYIGLLSAQGVVISSNQKLQSLLYDKNFKSTSPIWQHHYWESTASEQLKHFFSIDCHDEATEFEAEIWHVEQGTMILEIILKPMLHADRNIQYLLEARDITERKITEDR